MLELVVAVFSVLLLCTSASIPRLSDVSLLLPPKMTHAVEYRIEGVNGCFKWSWEHHDILSVIPDCNSDSHCCASAVVKSIAPYIGRKESAVYATDGHSGMVLYCKVYIDKFSRIQIFHDSIKLAIDELATLRVRAFDSQDNIFSSLVGVQFTWQLIPQSDVLLDRVVHLPLKVSPLGDCGGFCNDMSIRRKLEDGGLSSDLYVVKGMKFGRVDVLVNLMEPMYDPLSHRIVLVVAEVMSVTPSSPVHVLIGAVMQYGLSIIRGSYPQPVNLPSPYHKWHVSSDAIARVGTFDGKVCALRLGVTTITVEDTRFSGHIQTSSLHVVLPDFLRLKMLPLSFSGDLLAELASSPPISRWFIVSGRQYLIEMKVFTKGLSGTNEIYLTKNQTIMLHDDDSNPWKVFQLSSRVVVGHDSWNYRILEATSFGLGYLTATLSYSIGHHEAKEMVKVTQEVMVCDQVKFNVERPNASRSIVLLWSPSVYEELELKTTGGCANAPHNYKWFSSNTAIASVSDYGIVQSKMQGITTIRVASIFDSLNYDEVVIEVSTPSSSIIMQTFPLEIMFESKVRSSMTLEASDGVHFYRCDSFSTSIRWRTESDSFTVINTTNISTVGISLASGPLFFCPVSKINLWNGGGSCPLEAVGQNGTRIIEISEGQTVDASWKHKNREDKDRDAFFFLLLFFCVEMLIILVVSLVMDICYAGKVIIY